MKKQKPFSRSHGVLMPIFSLPSKFGIGTLGDSAKEFIDFLSASSATYWQMLPIGPTGYGNSPYQSFSAFGGNMLFIDPLWLLKKGWLTEDDVCQAFLPNNGKVDYALLFTLRKKLFKKAYEKFLKIALPKDKTDFDLFCLKESHWLDDYAGFMALKSFFDMRGRSDFKSFSLKSAAASAFINKNLAKEKNFAKFLEYLFFTQWQELKAYAGQKNIQLIGDIPLYVSNDSADVWSHPELFLLNDEGEPASVAGVPPDIFSKKGQLWGNPLYNWGEHQTRNFDWWKMRIEHQFKLFDIIRIDHFIGICRYYSIPAAEKTAQNGVWMEGPNKALTDAFMECENAKFIAEDLGAITPKVKKLINQTGFPGMSVMQFAFDGDDNSNLTHNIKANNVVYTGTHDNQTLKGFFASCRIKKRRNARLYLGVKHSKDLPEAVIRECFRCPANIAIIPLWDYLGLDDAARINTPSTLGDNWTWRCETGPSDLLAEKIKALATIYKRENKNDK